MVNYSIWDQTSVRGLYIYNGYVHTCITRPKGLGGILVKYPSLLQIDKLVMIKRDVNRQGNVVFSQ